MNSKEYTTKIDKNNMDMPILNPMVFLPRFQHITEQIFNQMNKDSLKGCRVLSKSWQKYIDNHNFLWKKLIEDEDPNKVFLSACEKDHSKMEEFLILKSAKFNIDFNTKDKWGRTAFHFVCLMGNSRIAKILGHRLDNNS